MLGLDFSADGRYLASCSRDKTIRVWDLEADPAHRTLAQLVGHEGEVTRVAFLPGDRLISTGGAGDGSLRVWDWRHPATWLDWTRPSDDDLKLGEGVRINAIALSPDRGQVVVGRENGRLERYSTVNLRDSILLNPDDVKQRRAVEALAFSADGTRLATSILKEAPTYEPGVLTRTDCVVSVRQMPAGQPGSEVLTRGDRVKALAFSPRDPRFLAMGGGDAHAVIVKDLGACGGPAGGGDAGAWNRDVECRVCGQQADRRLFAAASSRTGRLGVASVRSSGTDVQFGHQPRRTLPRDLGLSRLVDGDRPEQP